MLRTDYERLRDMVNAAEKAVEFCMPHDRDSFERDIKTQFAVVRCLEIVGEAAWRTTDITKATVPDVPWPRITNMRHRLIHDYFQVNLEVVWRTVQEDLPGFIRYVKRFLDATESGDEIR